MDRLVLSPYDVLALVTTVLVYLTTVLVIWEQSEASRVAVKMRTRIRREESVMIGINTLLLLLSLTLLWLPNKDNLDRLLFLFQRLKLSVVLLTAPFLFLLLNLFQLVHTLKEGIPSNSIMTAQVVTTGLSFPYGLIITALAFDLPGPEPVQWQLFLSGSLLLLFAFSSFGMIFESDLLADINEKLLEEENEESRILEMRRERHKEKILISIQEDRFQVGETTVSSGIDLEETCPKSRLLPMDSNGESFLLLKNCSEAEEVFVRLSLSHPEHYHLKSRLLVKPRDKILVKIQCRDKPDKQPGTLTAAWCFPSTPIQSVDFSIVPCE